MNKNVIYLADMGNGTTEGDETENQFQLPRRPAAKRQARSAPKAVRLQIPLISINQVKKDAMLIRDAANRVIAHCDDKALRTRAEDAPLKMARNELANVNHVLNMGKD